MNSGQSFFKSAANWSIGLMLVLISSASFAHPGHDLSQAGFFEGVLHTLLGIDHVTGMLLLGFIVYGISRAKRSF